MISGTAGHNDNPAEALHLLPGEGDIVQHDFSVPDTGGNGVPDRLGLLHNLLEHEVLITALFRCGNVPVNVYRLFVHLVTVGIEHGHPAAGQAHNLVVAQPVDFPGFRQNGGHVRGDKVFPLPQSHNQRAVFANGIQFVGGILTDDPKRIRAFHFVDDSDHGFQNIALIFFVVVFQQLGHYLGIRFGNKGDAPVHKEGFQCQVVFDDAIVHHRELSRIADLRM